MQWLKVFIKNHNLPTSIFSTSHFYPWSCGFLPRDCRMTAVFAASGPLTRQKGGRPKGSSNILSFQRLCIYWRTKVCREGHLCLIGITAHPQLKENLGRLELGFFFSFLFFLTFYFVYIYTNIYIYIYIGYSQYHSNVVKVSDAQ